MGASRSLARSSARRAASGSGQLDPARGGAWQRAVGNQAVLRALAKARAGGLANAVTALPVSHPKDASEIEAHATAERALRGATDRRLGQDPGDAHLHRDAESADAARALNARAFTIGSHVFFGQGEYAPETSAGRYVLAHELAHVAQNARGAPGAVIQRLPASGLDPWVERPSKEPERQRQEAFAIVRDQADHIRDVAAAYGITPDAIAGAILWEALENPYTVIPGILQKGPGKVHGDMAQLVEEQNLIQPKSQSHSDTNARLHDPAWAVSYIAAAMRYHADIYQRVAGVDISADAPVLCTLYHGGGPNSSHPDSQSEERAARLAERRKTDPTARPEPGNMGVWVQRYLGFIRALLYVGTRREH